MSTPAARPGYPRKTSSSISPPTSPGQGEVQGVMFAAQQPLAFAAFGEVMGVPAWKSLPSWFMVAESDEVIPPDAERPFAQRMGASTVEIASSHVAMISHPDAVVDLIETAVRGLEARVSVRRQGWRSDQQHVFSIRPKAPPTRDVGTGLRLAVATWMTSSAPAQNDAPRSVKRGFRGVGRGTARVRCIA